MKTGMYIVLIIGMLIVIGSVNGQPIPANQPSEYKDSRQLLEEVAKSQEGDRIFLQNRIDDIIQKQAEENTKLIGGIDTILDENRRLTTGSVFSVFLIVGGLMLITFATTNFYYIQREKQLVNSILSQTVEIQTAIKDIREGQKAFKMFVDDKEAFINLVANSHQLSDVLKDLKTEVEIAHPNKFLRLLGLTPYFKLRGK